MRSMTAARAEAGSGTAAPLLSREELQRFNTLLLRKMWERRDDVQLVSRRFVATLLDQTAQRVREKPYTWEQDEDDGSVSVRFQVPPECAKGDIKVRFGPQQLSVAVVGHPLQPHVLDATLLYAVVPADCSWALEGKGAKRNLVLTLEKSQPSLAWASLLDDADGRKKKGLSELAMQVEGVESAELKPYGIS